MDRLLDKAREGPLFLRAPEIAKLVVQSIYDGAGKLGRYKLHAYVVMPNHVHLLVTPKVNASKWLRSLKGFTGRQAIRIVGLTNTPFWQDESYDHLVRNDEEFRRIQRYIEFNPVRAGLAHTPEGFPWSSATPSRSSAAGQKP